MLSTSDFDSYRTLLRVSEFGSNRKEQNKKNLNLMSLFKFDGMNVTDHLRNYLVTPVGQVLRTVLEGLTSMSVKNISHREAGTLRKKFPTSFW